MKLEGKAVIMKQDDDPCDPGIRSDEWCDGGKSVWDEIFLETF